MAARPPQSNAEREKCVFFELICIKNAIFVAYTVLYAICKHRKGLFSKTENVQNITQNNQFYSMKKFGLFLCLSLLFAFAGCDKDETEDPVANTQLAKPEVSIASTTESSFKVVWEAVADAEGYKYQLAQEGETGEEIPVIAEQTTSATALSFDDLEPETKYILRVKAYAGGMEDSAYCKIFATTLAEEREPLTFTLIEGTINYSITDCNDNYSGELILPSMIPIEGTDYPVTEIAEWAFYACIRLSSVVIPEGITQIGRGAFSNCLGLSSVTLPEGLLQIGESSFASCSSLSEITIPESVTSIGNWAFRYCSNLSQVNIPNSITEIGDQTFRFCESLTSVTIPPSVTKIGAWAFAGCTSLKETNIGENVITIGEHAFSDCSSLAQVVVPDSTEEIAAWAFASCTSLKEIIIGENVTSIGDYAFSNCSSLTKMDIPDSVTTLGAGVFASCTSLKEIIVGNSVNSIGSEAFAYCDSTIYFKSDTPPEVGDNIFLDCPADMLICYPAGSEDNWGPEWQGFATQAWDPTSNPTPEHSDLRNRLQES